MHIEPVGEFRLPPIPTSIIMARGVVTTLLLLMMAAAAVFSVGGEDLPEYMPCPPAACE